jgi:uncharacterized protein
MPLVNTTKRKILCSKTSLCTSLASQTKGLMFSRPIEDKCLIFDFGKARRTDLHMFFVFFPIDILYLSEMRIVIDIKQNAKPFTPIIKSKTLARYIVEIPAGTISKTMTNIGDKLDFS